MRIDVVVEHRSDLLPMHHLRFFVDYWREAGHGVRVVNAFSPDAGADVGVLHIDRTVVADEVVAWCRRYPVMVNRSLTDISKRRVSRHTVGRGDGYAGPVIVKTDLNRGGKPERRRRGLAGLGPVDLVRRSIARHGGWRHVRQLPPENYPILPNVEAVPAWVWGRSDLVVERYLPEIRDGLYVSRIWVFLGEESYGRAEYSPTPVARAATTVRREYTFEVPDEVRETRRRMGADFGKIDWAHTSEGPVVFDVNRTPARATVPAGDDRTVMIGVARGIEAFARAAV